MSLLNLTPENQNFIMIKNEYSNDITNQHLGEVKLDPRLIRKNLYKHKMKMTNLKAMEKRKHSNKHLNLSTPRESKRSGVGSKPRRLSSLEPKNNEFYLYYNDEKYNLMLK